MKIAAIVLAAGASRRLGRPKQQVILGEETLLERTVRVAKEAELAPIVVVTRASMPLPCRADDAHVIVNHAADEGIASSIRAGVAAVDALDVEGAVVLACDQPGLSVAHLGLLTEDTQRLTASAYAESVGVPTYFPRAFFAALRGLRGDTGARFLLKDAYAVRAEELTLDVDTEEDVRAAQELFGREKRR